MYFYLILIVFFDFLRLVHLFRAEPEGIISLGAMTMADMVDPMARADKLRLQKQVYHSSIEQTVV